MIVEYVAVLVTLAAGVLLLHAAGLRGWGLAPLGHVVGVASISIVATLTTALGLSTSPVLAYLLPLAAAVVVWLRRPIPRPDRQRLVAFGAVVLAPLLLIVWAMRGAHLTRVTPDSYNLMISGSLMRQERLSEAPPRFLESWQVALGAVHGPANLQDELYLRSAMPLLAVALLLSLAWLIDRSLRGEDLPAGTAVATAALAATLLLTTNRYLYNALYLNRHVAVAAYLLVAAAAAWGLVRGRIAPRPVLMVLLTTTLPALAVTRAETPVLAGFVALPLLTSDRLPHRQRALVLMVLGLPVVVWNVHLLVLYAAVEERSIAAVGMLLLGTSALLLAVPTAIGWRPANPLPRWTMPTAEFVLWAALLAAAVLDPSILLESLEATARNVAFDHGGWGVTLVALALAAAAVLVVTREGDRVQLRFPMTAFLPFALLLAYLRTDGGLPYRVAAADSLNRMLFHIVPLALFYVATASTARPRWGATTGAVDVTASGARPSASTTPHVSRPSPASGSPAASTTSSTSDPKVEHP